MLRLRLASRPAIPHAVEVALVSCVGSLDLWVVDFTRCSIKLLISDLACVLTPGNKSPTRIRTQILFFVRCPNLCQIVHSTCRFLRRIPTRGIQPSITATRRWSRGCRQCGLTFLPRRGSKSCAPFAVTAVPLRQRCKNCGIETGVCSGELAAWHNVDFACRGVCHSMRARPPRELRDRGGILFESLHV